MITVVTGGAGFIGSTLVDRLLAAGHTVHVVDDFSTGSHANLADSRAAHGDRLHSRELDIRDPAVVDHIAALRPEVVFHLAAQIDVRLSVSRPVHDAEINIIGSLNVIEGARGGGARKVVFASSGGTIYGEVEPSALPVDELHPQRPLSPYGVAKKVVSDYLSAFRDLHGLDFTSLALANVYGPRQDPHGEAGVVAIFASNLLAGTQCRIFGDGEQTRDFVFVEDVADAFVRSADADRGSGLVINIGTGVETSVNELYEVMAEAAGVTTTPSHKPPRPGELARSALATRRAREVLGWQPTTDLAGGAIATLDWFRART
ncbi:MAG TPA: NAD-dependent epimerase/dehydratase family protein [Acidimicrobiales bacterium]|nr:NAD-dependent epimerase/dehydratase family protein [Acidimicrobiales bacterium]